MIILSIILIIAFFVGVIEIFGWLISAAFHLIPFLFGLGLAIGVVAMAYAVLGGVGAVLAIILLIIGCVAKGRHV